MDALVFVREPNAREYDDLGIRSFAALPRPDEFISAGATGSEKFYQVIGVHHPTEKGRAIEIYAIQAEPTWTLRKGRAIGFGH